MRVTIENQIVNKDIKINTYVRYIDDKFHIINNDKLLFFKLFLKFLCHLIEKLPGSVLVKTEFKYLL